MAALDQEHLEPPIPHREHHHIHRHRGALALGSRADPDSTRLVLRIRPWAASGLSRLGCLVGSGGRHSLFSSPARTARLTAYSIAQRGQPAGATSGGASCSPPNSRCYWACLEALERLLCRRQQLFEVAL